MRRPFDRNDDDDDDRGDFFFSSWNSLSFPFLSFFFVASLLFAFDEATVVLVFFFWFFLNCARVAVGPPGGGWSGPRSIDWLRLRPTNRHVFSIANHV